ncbi:MAG: sugar ABC transporter ATP-binding protein [Clostridiaceae bacterium]|nr:sugar ABC transporter ATP-binding protein [Clostridiaceae bacterium]
MEEKLKLVGISKSFPGVKALDNVDITLRKGTVHAIVGENGAGKSTLMKIISGLYRMDSGHIYLDGKEVTFSSPQESSHAGIAMIYQELNYFPDLSIEENLFMNRLPSSFGFMKWRELRKKCLELFEDKNINYHPENKVKDLSISDIQMLEILKAVAFNAEIIIMDEPTSSISNEDVEHLFNTIENLKKEGISILYISHKMDEIFKIADDITVLRDGKSVVTGLVSEFNSDSIITHMVGRSIENIYPKKKVAKQNIVLSVQNLSRSGIFENISFDVKAGEIVGFAGLIGAGRTEVARAVFGLDHYDSGSIFVEGNKAKITSPSSAIKNGIILLTEDRKREGIFSVRNVLENISISSLRVKKGAFINLKQERNEVIDIFNKLQVRAPSVDVNISTLSGGNQQKVILCRWLLVNAKVMIFDEPTRGIDVGAKFEIYNIMQKLAEMNKVAIVMISSELPELIGMCDKIYVMNRGNIAGCVEGNNMTQENIMRMAAGVGG